MPNDENRYYHTWWKAAINRERRRLRALEDTYFTLQHKDSEFAKAHERSIKVLKEMITLLEKHK